MFHGNVVNQRVPSLVDPVASEIEPRGPYRKVVLSQVFTPTFTISISTTVRTTTTAHFVTFQAKTTPVTKTPFTIIAAAFILQNNKTTMINNIHKTNNSKEKII